MVTGKIDRVDRQRDSGLLRILDYKTSEAGKTAEETHLGSIPKTGLTPDYAKLLIAGRAKRWMDLQLPLYIMLLGEDTLFQGKKVAGYFNLPRSIDETGINLWENLDETMIGAARICAENVIDAIQQRTFWPPTAKLPNDAFASLFQNNEPELCIDEPAFLAFMEEMKRSPLLRDRVKHSNWPIAT
jgi:hypothetical protein